MAHVLFVCVFVLERNAFLCRRNGPFGFFFRIVEGAGPDWLAFFFWF